MCLSFCDVQQSKRLLWRPNSFKNSRRALDVIENVYDSVPLALLKRLLGVSYALHYLKEKIQVGFKLSERGNQGIEPPRPIDCFPDRLTKVFSNSSGEMYPTPSFTSFVNVPKECPLIFRTVSWEKKSEVQFSHLIHQIKYRVQGACLWRYLLKYLWKICANVSTSRWVIFWPHICAMKIFDIVFRKSKTSSVKQRTLDCQVAPSFYTSQISFDTRLGNMLWICQTV